MIPGQRRREGTATRILEVAEREVQARGFASFSYASVAAELKITKAALHYHFPGKAELGLALIARYAARFAQERAMIDATARTALTKLDAYIDLFARVLGEEKMCLCGMLAAEFEILPATMRAEVIRFFDDNERWLAAVLTQGVAENSIRLGGDATGSAALFLSALEGAMLVARPYRDPERFRAVAAALLAGLTGAADPPRSPPAALPGRRAPRPAALKDRAKLPDYGLGKSAQSFRAGAPVGMRRPAATRALLGGVCVAMATQTPPDISGRRIIRARGSFRPADRA